MDTRDAFVVKMKAQLDQWNAELDQLEARAHLVQAEQQLAYHEHLATLRQHCHEAQLRLAQIQQATGGAWEEMRQGVEAAWNLLVQAFAHARARMDELKST
jgi:hypothetical protein